MLCTELSDTVKICSMYDMLLECAKIVEESGIAMNLEPLYDMYHMQLNEGSICDTVTAYGDIHVADAPGRYEPGTGEINYHIPPFSMI